MVSLSNQARPLELPARRWGGELYRRVHYREGVLGPLGWLLRWWGKGPPTKDVAARLELTRQVFDHVEYWLGYTEQLERKLDRRILVAHPYRFDAEMRAALAAAAQEHGLIWYAVPPRNEAFTPVTSWYSNRSWMIVVMPPGGFFIGAPEAAEVRIPRSRSQRHPLIAGETIEDLPPPSRRRGSAGIIRASDVLTNPARAMSRAQERDDLQEALRRVASIEEELRAARNRIAALEAEKLNNPQP